MNVMNCWAITLMFTLFCAYSRQVHYEGGRRGYMTGNIINGIDVPISMYPHVVGIAFNGNLYCGGSIISKRVVLTAAHCIVSPVSEIVFTPAMITVFAGSSWPNKGQQYDVCNLEPHPKYVPSHYSYDIGLIYTTKPFQFGPLIQQISIAPNQRWKDQKYKFTIAGYGVITTKGAIFANHLQATRLSYVDSKTCDGSQTNFKGTLTVPKHVFCLVGLGWSGDCYGDSGSGILWKRICWPRILVAGVPLRDPYNISLYAIFIYIPTIVITAIVFVLNSSALGSKYLVGIVSHGRDTYCGSDITPSMYTDVVYFKKWIEKATSTLKNKSCYKDVNKMSNVGIDYYFSSEET